MEKEVTRSNKGFIITVIMVLVLVVFASNFNTGYSIKSSRKYQEIEKIIYPPITYETTCTIKNEAIGEGHGFTCDEAKKAAEKACEEDCTRIRSQFSCPKDPPNLCPYKTGNSPSGCKAGDCVRDVHPSRPGLPEDQYSLARGPDCGIICSDKMPPPEGPPKT